MTLEETMRHRTFALIAILVLLFLIVFAGLMYFTKKKVWSSVH